MLALVGDALMAGVYRMAPAYAEQFLGMGVEGMSLVLSSIGIGAVIAALYLAWGGARVATVQRVIWSFLINACAVGILYLYSNLTIAIATCLIIGLASEIRTTASYSLIQLNVSEVQRGRVMGNMFLLAQLARGVGTYVIGVSASSHGLTLPMLAAVSISIVVWLVFYLRRDKP